jgi:hypothetical protein
MDDGEVLLMSEGQFRVFAESSERSRDADGCAMAVVAVALGLLVIVAFALPALLSSV